MTITRFPRAALALAILVSPGACGKAKDTAASRDSTAPSTADAGSLEGASRRDSSGAMAGMSGGTQRAANDAMMDMMQTEMLRMDGMSASQLKAVLPAHRQMAANMLSRMSTEMRSMNMPASAAWTATTDSVRQDLVHLPELSAQELKSAMPAHHARMTRLMQMHRDMMKNMKM
jgi:hypothetical protein